MDKEQGKSLILITLIVLCIWQTGKLWLGNNMSGLNFFEKPNKNILKQIEPDSIWLNPGAPATMIYRLGEDNREYQSVSNEIEKNIRAYMQKAKIVSVQSLDWEIILTKQGILYEYPIPLTYSEIVGDETIIPPKTLPQGEEIDYIFLQLSEENKGTMRWYLITSGEDKVYLLDVQGEFSNLRAFNDLLKEEALEVKVKYQPTFKMSGVSTKNIFLPLSSKELPIPYEVLEYNNPLDDFTKQEEFSRFNPYVNQFFFNPLLKKEEKTEDGVYIFSELMKAVVKYYPNGVFEYSNIGVGIPKYKSSRLKSYNIARDFLNNNESIPKEIKRRLYLSDIEQVETGYIFYFDMKLDGMPVYFSQNVREQLGINHMVEITVYGSNVSNFKWSAWVLEPKFQGNIPLIDNFTMKYTEGLNKVLEYVDAQGDATTLAIDDMRLVYMISSERQDVHAKWIVLHNNSWYSP